MYYLIIITIIQVFYLYYLFSPEKPIKISTIILLSFIALIKTPFYSLIDDLLYLFFIAWPVVALMGFIIVGNNIKKILEVSFFVELLTALSYYLAGGILMFFETFSFEQIYNYNIIIEKNSLVHAILSGIILIIFALLSKVANVRDFFIRGENDLNGMLILLGLNISFKLMYEIRRYDGLTYIFFVLINLIVLIMYMINKNLSYNKNLKDKEIREKEFIIKELSGYIETIEDLSNQINDLKHDCKNIIIGTNPEKINLMISNIENNLSKNTLYKIFINIKSIENHTIKSLFYYYIISAMKKNIYISIKVIGIISNVNITDEHLSRIIGILFDNAIEAASESNEKLIELYIENINENVDITISNSIKDNNIDVKNIFQRGYSSKGSERGLGLSIINKIISTYDNIDLYTNLYEKNFVQELYIKNNK